MLRLSITIDGAKMERSGETADLFAWGTELLQASPGADYHYEVGIVDGDTIDLFDLLFMAEELDLQQIEA